MAGREFVSWEALEAHLERWSREVADVRLHGTTGEHPVVRFQREEAAALQPLPQKPTFLAERELVRVVHNDACVEVEGNWCSVPWALLKQQVSMLLRDQQVQIRHGGRVVARHGRVAANRLHRSVLRGHWDGHGSTGAAGVGRTDTAVSRWPALRWARLHHVPALWGRNAAAGRGVVRSSELARSLAVYAAEVGEDVVA
jgi:hypothetical protein